VAVEAIPHETGLGGTYPLSIAAGFNHNLAIVNAVTDSTLPHCGTLDSICTRMVYGWGANDTGQLGDGGGPDAANAELLHVRGVTAVSAGGRHSAALNGSPFWPGIFGSDTPDPGPGPMVHAAGPEPPPGLAPPGPASGSKLSLTVPTATATPTHRPETQPTSTPTPLPTATSAPAAPTATMSPTARPTATSTPTPTGVPIIIIVVPTPTATLSPIR
jgi:hypothetical protein